jgi:hypothetical protein
MASLVDRLADANVLVNIERFSSWLEKTSLRDCP